MKSATLVVESSGKVTEFSLPEGVQTLDSLCRWENIAYMVQRKFYRPQNSLSRLQFSFSWPLIWKINHGFLLPYNYPISRLCDEIYTSCLTLEKIVSPIIHLLTHHLIQSKQSTEGGKIYTYSSSLSLKRSEMSIALQIVLFSTNMFVNVLITGKTFSEALRFWFPTALGETLNVYFIMLT